MKELINITNEELKRLVDNKIFDSLEELDLSGNKKPTDRGFGDADCSAERRRQVAATLQSAGIHVGVESPDSMHQLSIPLNQPALIIPETGEIGNGSSELPFDPGYSCLRVAKQVLLAKGLQERRQVELVSYVQASEKAFLPHFYQAVEQDLLFKRLTR